jgi:hypothetical protein
MVGQVSNNVNNDPSLFVFILLIFLEITTFPVLELSKLVSTSRVAGIADMNSLVLAS